MWIDHQYKFKKNIFISNLNHSSCIVWSTWIFFFFWAPEFKRDGKNTFTFYSHSYNPKLTFSLSITSFHRVPCDILTFLPAVSDTILTHLCLLGFFGWKQQKLALTKEKEKIFGKAIGVFPKPKGRYGMELAGTRWVQEVLLADIAWQPWQHASEMHFMMKGMKSSWLVFWRLY